MSHGREKWCARRSTGPQQKRNCHQIIASSSRSFDTAHYPNVFGSPDSALSDALLWARRNARQPHVAAWLEACSQWDSAIAAGEYMNRKKRRKLCKDHDIPCTRLIAHSDKELDAGLEYIRGVLTKRIHQIRATMKSNKLDNYFTHMATGSSLPEIEPVEIPDVATDVSSTYLRLRQKIDKNREDTNFHIVLGALNELRGYVTKQRLRKLTTEPRKTCKTIRQNFKDRSFKTISFDVSKSPAEATGSAQEETLLVTQSTTHIRGGHTTLSWGNYKILGRNLFLATVGSDDNGF